MNRAGLVIIQDRETQFDAPLYALIHQSRRFPLRVVYSTPSDNGCKQDAELGFSPGWDHLSSHSYPQRTLHQSGLLDLWRLARDLCRQKPGLIVICGYYPRSHLILALLLRLWGQRIGLRSDNTLGHTTFHGLRGKLRKILVGSVQRLFDTWHPVGDQAHAYLRVLSGIERPTYRFAYAVDNDWFATKSSKARSERLKFLQQQNWPADAFVVLGIMKWTPREDPLTLVSAFKLLEREIPNARLVLVGDGPIRDAVISACRALGNRVWLPGYMPYSQLPKLYGLANVFVHPAPGEPWGVSVTEALACGVPVLAADGVGAAHELLNDHNCGALFPNAAVTVLAKQLQTFAYDQSGGKDYASACRKAADQWHYRQTIEAFEHALTAK